GHEHRPGRGVVVGAERRLEAQLPEDRRPHDLEDGGREEEQDEHHHAQPQPAVGLPDRRLLLTILHDVTVALSPMPPGNSSWFDFMRRTLTRRSHMNRNSGTTPRPMKSVPAVSSRTDAPLEGRDECCRHDDPATRRLADR